MTSLSLSLCKCISNKGDEEQRKKDMYFTRERVKDKENEFCFNVG